MPESWWTGSVKRRVIQVFVVGQIIMFWEAFKALAAVVLLVSLGLHLGQLEGQVDGHLWYGLQMGFAAVALIPVVRLLRGRERGLHSQPA